MANEFENTLITTQGKLVIGEHDSIIILGSKSQSQIKECSRNLSKMLLESSMDLDITIADIVRKIECFCDGTASKFNSTRVSQKKVHKVFYKRYAETLSLLDSVSLYFKLQQAQLLKELKMLDYFSQIIETSKNELENCIEKALAELALKCEKKTVNENNVTSLTTEQDLEQWYLRLERHIEDLKITYTVSLQNQEQIKLLTKNNQILLDKIYSVITNTIPIWQTQMSLVLGVELLENRLKIQNKVLQITKTHLGQAKRVKKQRVIGKVKSINIEKVLLLNQRLKLALLDLEKVEKDDEKIRDTLKKIIVER